MSDGLRLKDYKCTVEFYVSHFLVREDKARLGRRRVQTLRIDAIDRGTSRWRGADVLVFNSAHWWSHYKTKSGLVSFSSSKFYKKQCLLILTGSTGLLRLFLYISRYI